MGTQWSLRNRENDQHQKHGVFNAANASAFAESRANTIEYAGLESLRIDDQVSIVVVAKQPLQLKLPELDGTRLA